MSHTGPYVYIESSTPRAPGESAVLLSPVVHTARYARSCLAFAYHVHGATPGSLAVLLADPLLAANVTVWRRDRAAGDVWLRASVTIDTSSPTRVSVARLRQRSIHEGR